MARLANRKSWWARRTRRIKDFNRKRIFLLRSM